MRTLIASYFFMAAVAMLNVSVSSSLPRDHLPTKLSRSISLLRGSYSPPPKSDARLFSNGFQLINQWFDSFSLEDPSEPQHLQYDGLKESSEFVTKLVIQETDVVGLQRVVVGGLSQGCAAALHILLNFEGQVAMAGFVGMSGWLPFRETLDPSVMDAEDEDGGNDDIFGSNDDDAEELFEQGGVERCRAAGQRSVPLPELQRTAANKARDIASLPPLSAAQAVTFSGTPVFLGHGRNDEKVSVDLGRQARHALEALRCKVCWRDYDEGHWCKVPEEIDDIVEFLQDIMA